MKLLVVGSGAREHALAWSLSKSPRVDRLFCAPGNPGTASLATNLPIAADAIGELVAAAVSSHVDLVVIGPEVPLAAGLADRLAECGVRAFGPTAAAARIESSKSWAKELMFRIGVPTARADVASSLTQARSCASRFGLPVVIKADGLAAGKGVTVARDEEQLESALEELFVSHSFGVAGDTVVVEEYLEGRELSVLAFCDGETISTMPPARDYKRIGDGDRGPNTGGMGAYSRPAFATTALIELVERRILQPVVRELAKIGSTFSGVLYAGLMLTRDGPRVIEFNCRFGDPETQVIIPLLESDLADVFESVVAGRLREEQVRWRSGCACGVVVASSGYPGPFRSGVPIVGLDTVADHGALFHAGTRIGASGSIETAGGRVLTAVGCGATTGQARAMAYEVARAVRFEGRYMRTDIAADDGPLPFDPTVTRDQREVLA